MFSSIVVIWYGMRDVGMGRSAAKSRRISHCPESGHPVCYYPLYAILTCAVETIESRWRCIGPGPILTKPQLPEPARGKHGVKKRKCCI